MRYLAVTGFRSEKELDAYLYSYAKVQDSGTTQAGVNWAVVELPEEHAEYQQTRLQSGWIGARVTLSEYEAAIAILERV